jgi:predicted SprT family Zn-dependent metalloprotease
MKQPPEKQTLPVVSPEDLLRVSGKKALDLILDSPAPVTLVQSLAEEDLFWLIQEIGPEDALPILSLASNDQWQYLLDLELWTKDRLEIDSVNRWLGLLLKADPDRLLIWGLREHIELIELHMFKHIEVRIREEDESPSDFGEGYFSPDNLFYIRINNDQYEQTTREFLERLAHHDLSIFHKVLLELAGALPAEVEERMYSLRNVRLAEKGFLPFEDAIGIYQHLNPERLAEKEPQLRKVIQEESLHYPVPVSTVALIQGQNLFHLSLQQIGDVRLVQRLQIEFAAVCNRIISADVLMVRDKEHLAAVVRKACGYLSIGLDRVTQGDVQKATRLVQGFPLAQIFRVGYGAALELRWKTEKWLQGSWFGGQDFDLSFWGDAWEGMLEGLLKKRPLFHTDLAEGEPYREFESLEDVTHCESALEEIMAADQLLSQLFAQGSIVHPIVAYQPVNHKNLVLTCWARDYLGLPDDIEPVSVKELKAFFRDLWEKKTKPRRVAQRMKQAFWEWFQMRSEEAIDEISDQARRTIDRLLGELEKEYGSVSLKDLDTRYIKHLLVVP